MHIGHLNVTTFRGISIGAEHWYGDLHIENADDSNDHHEIELSRKLSDKEVLALNKKAGARIYESGDKSTGFNTEAEVWEIGIQKFKSDYKGILLTGDSACWSAWANVLVYPDSFAPIVHEMNEIAKEFQSLNGYEGSEQSKVEKLDDRWMRRYKIIRNLCKT